MGWTVFSLEPAAGFGSPTLQSHISVPAGNPAAPCSDHRKDGVFPSLNSPGFRALSETISVIELSSWWFLYDKGVITQ